MTTPVGVSVSVSLSFIISISSTSCLKMPLYMPPPRCAILFVVVVGITVYLIRTILPLLVSCKVGKAKKEI